MPNWPDFMPAPVQEQISVGAPQGAVIRTAMDAGPAKQRKRFTAAPRPVALVFQPVSTDKLASFDAFYINDLACGALAFDMAHPITDQVRRFRLSASDEPWQITAIGKDTYVLAVNLELLP